MVEGKAKKKGLFIRFLDGLEAAGNKMCDPLTIFVAITVIILICSAIFGAMGVSVINPVDKKAITVVNLLDSKGLVRIMTEFTSNVVNFPPFILMVVSMLGIGIADSTGLMKALMKVSVLRAPKFLILPILIFVGINSNIAGNAGYILLPIIGAMVFQGMGKNPIVGMIVGYASAGAGFNASVLIGSTDVLLAGFTQSSARLLMPEYSVNPTFNFYFLATSAILLVPVGVWVTKAFVEPRMGTYSGELIANEVVTDSERKGLRWAGVAAILVVAALLAMAIPKNGLLRDPADGSLTSMKAPLMSGIVFLIMAVFMIPALAYGLGAKVFKSDKDIVKHLAKAMEGLGSYTVFCVVAAQMLAYFNWSKLGPVLAIKGAEFLKAIGVTGLPALLFFLLLTVIINFLITSSSAKWAIFGPVFVPMFLLLGYDPAFTTAIYRIGDSVTNSLTPLSAFFPILLGVAQKYDKNVGMGTLIAGLLPFSLWFLIAWIVQLIVWYLLGIPVGPGAGIFMTI